MKSYTAWIWGQFRFGDAQVDQSKLIHHHVFEVFFFDEQNWTQVKQSLEQDTEGDRLDFPAAKLATAEGILADETTVPQIKALCREVAARLTPFVDTNATFRQKYTDAVKDIRRQRDYKLIVIRQDIAAKFYVLITPVVKDSADCGFFVQFLPIDSDTRRTLDLLLRAYATIPFVYPMERDSELLSRDQLTELGQALLNAVENLPVRQQALLVERMARNLPSEIVHQMIAGTRPELTIAPTKPPRYSPDDRVRKSTHAGNDVPSPPLQDVWTVEETARHLNLDRTTVARLLREKKLLGWKKGKRLWVVDPQSARNYPKTNRGRPRKAV